jgi:uncharacterized alkaline shock family protein YloU
VTGGGERVSTAVPAQVPAAERGALRIADRVVAKVAAQAAREVLREAPRAEHVPNDATPDASVSVRRKAVRVRLSVELGYPSDIGSACRSVRRHVAERVKALIGMEVPEVAIEIKRLHSSATRTVDEGRVR